MTSVNNNIGNTVGPVLSECTAGGSRETGYNVTLTGVLFCLSTVATNPKITQSENTGYHTYAGIAACTFSHPAQYI